MTSIDLELPLCISVMPHTDQKFLRTAAQQEELAPIWKIERARHALGTQGPCTTTPSHRKPSEMPVTYKDMYLTLMGRLIQLRTLLEASDPEMYKEVVDRWLDEHVKF